jgi:serine/threonine protein kinase
MCILLRRADTPYPPLFCSIKPENIVVVPGSKPPVVKLIDFGLCQFTDPDNCSDGCGSVDFASPETVRCALGTLETFDGRKSDMWSLGIVLFELITWKYPFDRDERLTALHQGRPQPNLHFSRRIPTTPAYQNLVRLLITERADDRISAADALTHPWITESTR